MSSPPSRRSSQCPTDCLLERLKVIQKRTEANQQYLTTPYLRPFLTTNDPFYPESMQYHSIRLGYLRSRVDRWYLDDIVQDIQDLLEGAKETRNQLMASITSFDSLFHPVRSLPDDILLLIFEQCLLSYWQVIKAAEGGRYLFNGSEAVPRGSLESRYPPWQLSLVCQRWRRLALASPRLWSIIHLPASIFEMTPREDAIVSRLDLYLKRSRNLLLDVRIGWCGETCFEVLEDKDKVVSLLRATTHRWHTLHMNAGQPEQGYEDDTIFLGCSFPNLTRVEVKDSHDIPENVVLATFRDTPNLVHIRAYNIKVDINWRNIISYRTCAPSLAAHSLLPSLQRLSIDGSSSDNFELHFVDDLPPLSLPVLHTLRIIFKDPEDLKILDYLSMPTLETLQIQFHYWCSEPGHYPDLRRWDRLRNLSLSFTVGREPEAEPLVSFLSGVPHIVTLHLLDDTLLKTAILRMNGIDDLFPCLESLGLEASILQNPSAEVQAIVESRLNVPIPKIRELKTNMERAHYWYARSMGDWKVTFERVRSLGVKVISCDIKNF